MVSRFAATEDLASKLSAERYHSGNGRGGCNITSWKVRVEFQLQRFRTLFGLLSQCKIIFHRFVAEYEAQLDVNNNHAFEIIGEDFQQFIIRVSEEFLVRVSSRYLVGATIRSSNHITAWFNNQVNVATFSEIVKIMGSRENS